MCRKPRPEGTARVRFPERDCGNFKLSVGRPGLRVHVQMLGTYLGSIILTSCDMVGLYDENTYHLELITNQLNKESRVVQSWRGCAARGARIRRLITKKVAESAITLMSHP